MRNTHLCYTLLLAALGAMGWYRNQQQTLVEQEAYQPEVGIKVMEADIRSLLVHIGRYAEMYHNPSNALYLAQAIQGDSLVSNNLAHISSASSAEYELLMDTLKTRLCQLANNDPTVVEQLHQLLPSAPEHVLCPISLLQGQTEIEKTRTFQLLRTQYLMALQTVLKYRADRMHWDPCCWCGATQPTLICDRLFPAVGDTLQHTVVLAGYDHEVPRVAYILVNGDTLPDFRDEISRFEHVYPTPGVYPLSVTLVYWEKPFFDTFQTTTKDFWVRVR